MEKAMQDSWKERLLEEAFIYQGKEVGVIETITFDYDKLEDFISSEIDKAREDILREVLSKGRDLSVLHLAPHIPVSDVEEMLSKLNNK